MRLGLIPARSGSERLPGKNTIDLGGKPLIAWTIEIARESALFDRVVVSTDDHGVAAVAKSYNCEVIDRPKEIAQADTDSISVVRHACMGMTHGEICLLQPTSPFRSVADLDNSLKLLAATDGDAVVSVTEAPNDLAFDLGLGNRLRPKQNVLVCNGAIYWITAKHLRDGGDWYGGVTYGYPMPKERSLDIDTKADLERARKYLLREAA